MAKNTKNNVASINNSFRFLQKSYDETLELLNLTHNYFTKNGKADKSLLSKENQVVYVLVMSDIVTQLSSVLSWLMIWKAVENNEITLDEAKSEENKLLDLQIKTHQNDSVHAILTKPVKYLLDKSSELYNRIQRLEQTMMKHG